MSEIYDWNVVDDSNIDLFPEGMLVKNVNNSARVLQGATARLYSDTDGTLTAGGTADAITITTNQTISAYFDGLALMFDMPGTNTGAVTINVNSLGAKTVKKQATTDVEAGELISGQRIQVSYDGTNFQLVSGYLDADAAASAAAAAASAAAASTSETNAATSESNAATSASNASTSETNAATSASNASTSETNAATSASNASTSETNAATSETNAAASAAAAQVAKIEWQGDYSGATAYELNDAVHYQGSSFICIQAGTGNTPAVGGTVYWDDLALKGDAGDGDVTGPGSSTDSGFAKFDGTTGKLLKDSAATIAVSDLAIGTDGELITWDASGNPATVGVGTANQVLTSNGSGAAPTFQDASGGAWVVASSGTFSSASQLDITGITKYTAVVITNAKGSAASSFFIRTSTDGGSTYDSGGSDYAYSYVEDGTGTTLANQSATADDHISTGVTMSSFLAFDSAITVILPNPTDTSATLVQFNGSLTGGTSIVNSHGSGTRNAQEDVDAVRIYPNTGTFEGSYVVLELN